MASQTLNHFVQRNRVVEIRKEFSIDIEQIGDRRMGHVIFINVEWIGSTPRKYPKNAFDFVNLCP